VDIVGVLIAVAIFATLLVAIEGFDRV